MDMLKTACALSLLLTIIGQVAYRSTGLDVFTEVSTLGSFLALFTGLWAIWRCVGGKR
jgi:hypothetical protein